MDLAVAVVIGQQINLVVQSLVADIITPVLAIFRYIYVYSMNRISYIVFLNTISYV